MHRFTSAYFTFSSFQFSFAIYVKITLLRHVCFDTIYLIYMYDSIRKIWRTSFVCVADLQPSIAKYSSFIQERLSTKYSYGRHDDVEKMQSQLREKSVNFETHERHKTFSSWKQYYGNFKTWKQSPVWSCYFITLFFKRRAGAQFFQEFKYYISLQEKEFCRVLDVVWRYCDPIFLLCYRLTLDVYHMLTS